MVISEKEECNGRTHTNKLDSTFIPHAVKYVSISQFEPLQIRVRYQVNGKRA